MLCCYGFSHSHHCYGAKFVHWTFVANLILRLSTYWVKAILLLMHLAATLIWYPLAVLCSMLVISKWQSPHRWLMFKLRLQMMCWASCSERRLLQQVLSGHVGLMPHMKIAIYLFWGTVWFAILVGMTLGLLWCLLTKFCSRFWSRCTMIPRLEVILACIALWVPCVCATGDLVCRVMSVDTSDVIWFVSKQRLWPTNYRGFCSHCLSWNMPSLT